MLYGKATINLKATCKNVFCSRVDLKESGVSFRHHLKVHGAEYDITTFKPTSKCYIHSSYRQLRLICEKLEISVTLRLTGAQALFPGIRLNPALYVFYKYYFGNDCEKNN